MLQNKTAVITGGGRGIGRSIALTLAQAGADIAVCDINKEAADSVAGEVIGLGRKAYGFNVDVSNAESVNNCVSKALDSMEKIDILVNNAGITRDSLLVRMKDEDWELVLKINLTGTYNFTKAVAKYMMRRRTGRIISIASIIGLVGNPGQANYGASKAGIIGFTKSCARELAPRGINVNAVAPGFIDTQMTKNLPQDVKDKMLKNVPLARFGAPEDVANVVLFLAGPLSGYVTGQVINVCGGMVMQ